LARTSNLFVNRKRTLVQFDANPRPLRDFVQRTGDAAARRVAHAANVAIYVGIYVRICIRRHVEHCSHQSVQGSAVALDLSLEFQPLALRQNRNAVIADRTAENDLVPGTGSVGGKIESFW